jgi:hypothetical protein
MAILLSDPGRTAAVAAITGLADAGAGPATIQVGTAAFAVSLAVFTLSDPAYTAGSAGVQTLDVTPALSTTALASNTAAVWRLRDSNSVLVMDGPVATTGGGDINLAPAAAIAALDAIDNHINTTGSTDAAGSIQLLTAGDAVLVTIPLSNPAFAAATGAGPCTMAITGTPSANATAAGTATKFILRDRARTTVISGTAGTSGTDMIINNAVLGIGSTVTVSTFTFTLPLTSSASDGVLVFAGGVAFTLGEQLEIASGSFTFPAT